MSWKLHGLPGATEIMGTEIVKNSVSAWDSTFIKGEGSILGFVDSLFIGEFKT